MHCLFHRGLYLSREDKVSPCVLVSKDEQILKHKEMKVKLTMKKFFTEKFIVKGESTTWIILLVQAEEKSVDHNSFPLNIRNWKELSVIWVLKS